MEPTLFDQAELEMISSTGVLVSPLLDADVIGVIGKMSEMGSKRNE